jgi:hypothetical protein
MHVEAERRLRKFLFFLIQKDKEAEKRAVTSPISSRKKVQRLGLSSVSWFPSIHLPSFSIRYLPLEYIPYRTEL